MLRLTIPNKALKRQPSKELDEQTASLLNLPWDVQRLIFENVPTTIWRSIPIGCDGFYYSAKSTEIDLLQVCRQFNVGASLAMQQSQADQPCVLTFNPFLYFGVTLAILETINLARTYDETYTKRVPEDQAPALSISPLAAESAFQAFNHGITKALRHRFRGDISEPELSQEAFNTFITQVLLQLRRKPKIELHLHLPKRGAWLLQNTHCSLIGPIVSCFLQLVQGNHPGITGTLRYSFTIVSDNEEIQRQLHGRWPRSQVGIAKWEVATKQDQEAWDELDNASDDYYREDGESRSQREQAAYLAKRKKVRAYTL